MTDTNTEPRVPGTNTGHGHVWPRPDRRRYRCGGPRMCQQCRDDQDQLAAAVIAGVRAYRPDPVDSVRPVRVEVAGGTADLTPVEALLLAAQLTAASRTEPTQ